MCGRYFMDSGDAGIDALIAEINRRTGGDAPVIRCGEIRPTDTAPVIANSRRRTPRPFAMQWGFAGFGRVKRPVINARSETAAASPMFADAMKNRRCLVPASHYFEWQRRDGDRVKYAIGTPGRMIYMAGLYRFEADRPLPVFTILTRKASPDVAHIHDRMPVILREALLDEWLSPDGDAQAVMDAAVESVSCQAVP